jgi:hypothetical protein
MQAVIAGLASPVKVDNNRPTAASPQTLSLGLAMVMVVDGMSVFSVRNISSF